MHCERHRQWAFYKDRMDILQIIFVFVSPYDTKNSNVGDHVVKHGDGVKDVAFEVQDIEYIVKVSTFLFSLCSNEGLNFH